MFDGLLMAAVAAEFRQNLLGARVDKIYQPARLEVVMTMRQPGKNNYGFGVIRSGGGSSSYHRGGS